MKQLYNKKGQMGGAINAVVALIAGVGVSILVLIFVGTLGGQTYNIAETKINAIANNAVVNELFTASNSTAVSLANTYVQEGTLTIYNVTQLLGLGNFTIDYPAGTLLLTGNMDFNASALNASYTWGDTAIRTSIKSGITSSFTALEQTGDYLPIIVLAIVIALVLALVLGMTGLSGGRAGGGTAL